MEKGEIYMTGLLLWETKELLNKNLMETIMKYQAQNLQVEIQYSITDHWFSALIIGRIK